MRRDNLSLALRFHMDTSFLISTGFGNSRANQVAIRNHQKQFTLPASSIKGRLRYHMVLFQRLLQQHQENPETSSVADRLFGVLNKRGQLFFEVGRLCNWQLDLDPSELRSGIKVERFTGSVADKHLRFYETSAPGLAFETTVEGTLGGGVHGHELNLLLGALQLIRKMGAGKSRGLGRCHVEVLSMDLGDKSYTSLQLEGFLESYVQARLGEVKA